MNLTRLLKYYYTENEGWERVWRENYTKIQKLTLHEKARLRLILRKRFGPNMKRIFMGEVCRRDYALQKIAKCDSWAGAEIVIPFGESVVKSMKPWKDEE